MCGGVRFPVDGSDHFDEMGCWAGLLGQGFFVLLGWFVASIYCWLTTGSVLLCCPVCSVGYIGCTNRSIYQFVLPFSVDCFPCFHFHRRQTNVSAFQKEKGETLLNGNGRSPRRQQFGLRRSAQLETKNCQDHAAKRQHWVLVVCTQEFTGQARHHPAIYLPAS